MLNLPLPRIDTDEKLREILLPYCRIKPGEIWIDSKGKHKVGCLEADNKNSIKELFGSKLSNGRQEKSTLAIHDPPYNFVAFKKSNISDFIDWSKLWIENSYESLDENSSLYIWLGADQNEQFQPLADFMLMMRSSGFQSKSFITMRNQRGYGTQKNWMAVRQELLYYVKGKPEFNTDAEYTDIPKILKGYYKKVNGKETENSERSKSPFIRAGNVWVDIQQVFYRMDENVNGCYAQKPLKSTERIILASSKINDIVLDFFAHSGTTLLASEILNRKCYTIDIDPIYCEVSIRRLENYRSSKRTGWQNSNPFEKEILTDKKLSKHLTNNYNIEIPKNLVLK